MEKVIAMDEQRPDPNTLRAAYRELARVARISSTTDSERVDIASVQNLLLRLTTELLRSDWVIHKGSAVPRHNRSMTAP